MHRFAPPLPWLVTVLGKLAVAFLIACPAHSTVVAERITSENFASHHVGGPDADAGIGDWFLSNGTLCAAISAPDHESPLAPSGGLLLDLGHCGRNDDQWAVLQPLLNLSKDHLLPASKLDAGVTAEEAWIQTRSLFAGVELVATYSLSTAQPDALRVRTRARRLEVGDSLFAIGMIVLHASGQTRPFSLSRSDPESSLGFQYPEADRNSIVSMLGALVASDLNVLVGAGAMKPISYGIEQRGSHLEQDGRSRDRLGTVIVTGLHYTTFNSLTGVPWFDADGGSPGWIDLARLPFMDLNIGTTLESELLIRVGERADVASITDQLWKDEPTVEGRIDDSEARIHIATEAGAPVTVVAPHADGRLRFHLPPGAYRARALADAGRSATASFVVDAANRTTNLPPLVLGPAAWVRLPSAFLGRLVFLPADGGLPLVFDEDLLGFEIGGRAIPGGVEAPFLTLAGIAQDPDRVEIVPGHYRVLAVRGPEYALAEMALEAVAGAEASLDIPPLARVRETPGWVAADLHVHSGESFDSGLPQTRQVAAFAASGAEVLVASEHDRIFDPRPAVRATNLGDELVAITGVEVTSAFEGGDSPYSTGHWNAFPVTYERQAYRGGAPTLEGRRAHDAIADIRRQQPEAFLQLNHPRPGAHGGDGDTYFSHLGVAGAPYDPTLPLDRAPNSVLTESGADHGARDLDFDGIELMNGPDMLRYRQVRGDWFSLLLQGEFKVATANSDSHRLGVIVGLPRTYVASGADSLGSFSETAFTQALRGGHAYGSTGPLLQLRLGDAGIGDTFSGSKGILRIAVDAADWVPIREWRVYANGELVHRAPIAAGETASIPMVFARDAFVTVEVEGPAQGRYASVLPGFVPFAFSNPIFVDRDGNGRFDAPGLPDRLPRSLTDPEHPD